MRQHLPIVLLFLIFPVIASSQIAPAEGRILNYCIIGFKVPPKENTREYTFEIASGTWNAEPAFLKHLLLKEVANDNKVIGEVPAFGSFYTWRVVCGKGKSRQTSTFYHFATGNIPDADTANVRLRIADPAKRFTDAYILCDGSRVIYDMNGRPVWYLPLAAGINLTPRDMKANSSGTITLLDGSGYEFDYDGNIVWKTPPPGAGPVNAEYHHEFTKRPNGNYMVLGMEYVSCKRPVKEDDHSVVLEDGGAGTPGPRLRFGTILEFSKDGGLLWTWKLSDYFRKSDISNFRSPGPAPVVDLHDNSFFFDENNKVIYLSLRNINRIIKIKYPSGEVVGTYGQRFSTDGSIAANMLFCGQHSISCSGDDLLLFNNNHCHQGGSPAVCRFRQSRQGTLQKIWECECSSGITKDLGFASGGNLVELPGDYFFISTAAPDAGVFIINEKKQIQWSAVLEKWSEPEKTWKPLTQYKASIIPDRKSLEQLIWHATGND